MVNLKDRGSQISSSRERDKVVKVTTMVESSLPIPWETTVLYD